MKNFRKKKITALLLVVTILISLSGCESKTESAQRGKNRDYTVVTTRDCPEDFLKEVEEKKINAFQMSYLDGEYLYVAVGYGEQATGGYSIAVRGFYELGDALCLEAELLGPGKDETVKDAPSYPFLIIKTEKTEEEVIFDI